MVIISERERKLLIESSVGLKVAKEISELKYLGEFNFVNHRRFSILDAYFDTSDLRLTKKEGYLRIRCKNGEHFITIRLPVQELGDPPRINEATYPLDDKALQLVFKTLCDNKLLNSKVNFEKIFFSEILIDAGLKEILRLRNNRIDFTILSEENKIGRVKVDTFFYEGKEHEKFYELEIDTYRGAYMETTERLIGYFMEEFPNMLSIHFMSKFERGLKIFNL